MISIEKLKKVKRLITHGPSCPDGVASALIIKDALPDVEVLFMAHGTEEHRRLEPQPGMLFCDFTPYVPQVVSGPAGVDVQKLKAQYDQNQLQAWIDAGCLVLDHHPTQRDVTMKFVEAGLGAYGENDRGECGAWLAYEHVWLPLFEPVKAPTLFYNGSVQELEASPDPLPGQVRRFAELAGVRDTWKREDPRWRAACEQAEELMFWPFEQQWLLSDGGNGLGAALFEKKLESARTAIKESHTFTTARGTRVLVFQGVSPTSDAAEWIEKNPPPGFFCGCLIPAPGTNAPPCPNCGGTGHTPSYPHIVAGFHYRVDAGRLQLQFSTRSHSGYDVGAFCKARGGGGHRAAAGFTVEQSAECGANPYAVFRLLLEEYEVG